jgi:ketosteroid isomerase-like protein
MGEVKSLADQAWKFIEAGEVDRLDEVFASDIVWTWPGGVKLQGLDQVKGFLWAWLEAFPDLHHEEVDSGEWNGTLANEIRISGTHTGTLKTATWEIPASRKTVTWESVDWIKARDGKITWWKEYNDQVPFLVATGLIPDPNKH